MPGCSATPADGVASSTRPSSNSPPTWAARDQVPARMTAPVTPSPAVNTRHRLTCPRSLRRAMLRSPSRVPQQVPRRQRAYRQAGRKLPPPPDEPARHQRSPSLCQPHQGSRRRARPKAARPRLQCTPPGEPPSSVPVKGCSRPAGTRRQLRARPVASNFSTFFEVRRTTAAPARAVQAPRRRSGNPPRNRRSGPGGRFTVRLCDKAPITAGYLSLDGPELSNFRMVPGSPARNRVIMPAPKPAPRRTRSPCRAA